MTRSKKDYYAGVRFAPYDIVMEFLVALVLITGLVVILAGVLSSPDVPPLTLKGIAHKTPLGFTQGALSELDGTSAIAGYGPPYTNTPDVAQNFGFISPQSWAGVHIPINTANAFVIQPLSRSSGPDPALRSALAQFKSASPVQKSKWETAYGVALGKASQNGSRLSVPACGCGPVSTMMDHMLALGQSGAMDGLLLTSGHFYQTDYTRPILFTADSGAMDALAAKYNLKGSTWGVMNETGNYPGQAWLWLFTMLYQIPPYSGAFHIFGVVIDWSASADLMAVITITILSLLLMFLPWIPGLNRLPRYLGVYRLIWKDYYREQRQEPNPAPGSGGST